MILVILMAFITGVYFNGIWPSNDVNKLRNEQRDKNLV